jgi:hypothetical protein
LYADIEAALRPLANVHLLEKSIYDMDGGVRVLGTTLWSNTASSRADSYLNDYRYICMPQGGRATVEYLNSLHTGNVAWLELELQAASSLNKKAVVLTHHMPSFDLVSNKYSGYGDLNTAFASNLDHLCKNASYWLFGHTHDSIHKSINECVCLSNPYGYGDENEAFERQAYISITS